MNSDLGYMQRHKDLKRTIRSATGYMRTTTATVVILKTVGARLYEAHKDIARWDTNGVGGWLHMKATKKVDQLQTKCIKKDLRSG